MIMKVSPVHAVFLSVCVFSFGARAEVGGPEIALNASAGHQYDSNVNIATTDTNTGEADTALLLKLGLDGAIPLNDKLSLALGYGYVSTTYATFSSFDLAVHHARAALRYAAAGFDSSLSLDQFAAAVDDGQFLDIRQASPGLARLIGQKLYLRGSFTRAEKDFSGNSERDAFNNAIRGDAYVLVDGMESYIALTYRVANEDAKASEFDYKGRDAKITFAHRLQAGRVKLDWETFLQVENRNYTGAPDPDNAPRRDERFRAGMSAAMPVSERIALKGEFEYGGNDSNLAAANFDEVVYSISVAVEI
jgi:hypothetical protein